VGISENFLSDDLANNLKENLYKLNKQDLLLA
jgi:SM-20-related protein